MGMGPAGKHQSGFHVCFCIVVAGPPASSTGRPLPLAHFGRVGNLE